MKPSQVLDAQADLLARLTDPVVRRTWTAHLTLDHVGSDDQSNPERVRVARSNSAALVGVMEQAVREAAAFHVTPDMTTLVMHAAAGLEPLDRIDRTIMPTRCGLARFEQGLSIRDARGKEMLANWVAWGPVLAQMARHDQGEPMTATSLYFWNDGWEQPDQIARERDEMLRGERPIPPLVSGGDVETHRRLMKVEREHMGRWGFVGGEILYDGQRLGPAYTAPDHSKYAEILEAGQVPSEFTNVTRLVHAFWLLLGQTVVEQREADVDRQTRKRAGRAGLPPRVTVIELRRRESGRSEGESLVEWSHRWVTRGHWRWQHCSDKHPLAQEVAPGDWRCRLWIAPHVKGPAGKPLVVSEKVYALKR